MLGRGIDVPLRIPEVIIRSITLGSIDTVAEGDAHANIVIRPDVSTHSRSRPSTRSTR